MHRVIAIGGTTFDLIAPDGARLARFESGHLDGSGQWVEDEDLDDAARAAAGLDEAVEIELPF